MSLRPAMQVALDNWLTNEEATRPEVVECSVCGEDVELSEIRDNDGECGACAEKSESAGNARRIRDRDVERRMETALLAAAMDLNYHDRRVVVELLVGFRRKEATP